MPIRPYLKQLLIIFATCLTVQPALSMQQARVSYLQTIKNHVRIYRRSLQEQTRRIITSPYIARSAPIFVSALYDSFMASLLFNPYFPNVPLLLQAVLILYGEAGVHFPYIIAEAIAHDSLLNAIGTNNINLVHYLIATQWVNLNPRFSTIFHIPIGHPLVLATQLGNPVIFKLLLEQGAQLTINTPSGNTLADYTAALPTDTPAICRGKLAIKKIILDDKLQKRMLYFAKEATQEQYRAQYEPTEVKTAEAMMLLHTDMYGDKEIALTQDIIQIVQSYLTPEYVDIPKRRPARKK